MAINSRPRRVRAWVVHSLATSDIAGLPLPASPADAAALINHTPPVVLVAPIGGDRYALLVRGRDPARLAHWPRVNALIAPPQSNEVATALQSLDASAALSERAALSDALYGLGLPDWQIGALLGIATSRACRLRLLHTASPELQAAVHGRGPFSFGHARALLHLDHTRQVAGLASFRAEHQRVGAPPTVAQFEALIRGPRVVTADPLEPNRRKAEAQIAQVFGTAVQLESSASGGGKLRVAWHSVEQLVGLMERWTAVSRATAAASSKESPRWLSVDYRDNDELGELVGGAFESDA